MSSAIYTWSAFPQKLDNRGKIGEVLQRPRLADAEQLAA